MTTRVSFYGGLGEIGRNMAAVEVAGRVALIDVGLTFPDAEHHGVDLILPDWSRLRERASDVELVVITHGHEDHMGALPFFLRDFPGVPVFATQLTLALLEAKLEEYPDVDADLRVVEAGERVEFGAFDMEFVAVSHSIPDGVAVAVHTPDGTILHTGDFKLDLTPIDGRATDLGHLAQLGDEGVALVLADSTNADRAGFVPTEQTVGAALRDVFEQATGRLVVTTFASHIHRVQQVIDSATASERLVCFVGRSMLRNMPIARELGYLRYDDRQVVELAEVERLPRERVALVCTGSQGEPFAALSLMAAGEHRQVSLDPGDTVVMASSVIPGNEHAIYRVINGLFRRGAQVVYPETAPVHVSGHAAVEELKVFHSLVRPGGVIPVHGEYRHLIAHAALARALGVDADQVLVCEDGDEVALDDGRVSRAGSFQPGVVYVDGLGVGDVGNAVLRDRGHLSSEGICVAVITLDHRGRLNGRPELVQQGVVYRGEDEQLLKEATTVLEEELRREGEGAPSVVRRATSRALGAFWRERTGRRPVILPVVVEL